MNTIRINILHNGTSLFVKMRRDQPLKLALVSYCQRNNINLNSVLFQVRRTGVYLSPYDTPMHLNQDEEIVAIY